MPDTAEQVVAQAADGLAVEASGALLVRVRRGITNKLALEWVRNRDTLSAERELRERMERYGDRLYRVEDRIARGVGASTEVPINNLSNLKQKFTFKPAERLNVIVRRQRGQFIRNITDDQLRVLQDAMNTAFADFDALPVERPVGAEERIARHIRTAFALGMRQTQGSRNFERALNGIDKQGIRTPNGSPHPSYRDYKLRDMAQDRIIDRAIASGEPLNVTQIKNATNGYEANAITRRATTIARTETTKVINIARLESWRQWAAEEGESLRNIKRFWIVNRDDSLRPAHAAIPGMNKSGRGLNSVFKTPLGDLLYPGDSQRGRPANTINCRCTLRTRVNGRSEKRQAEVVRTVEQMAAFRRVAGRRSTQS